MSHNAMRLFGFIRATELLGLAFLLMGCDAADKKCASLRGMASQAWAGYAAQLQVEEVSTRASLAAAKKKLEGEINQRHEAQARRHADQLHGTETSTAWYRTFLATTQAQCSKDPECLELKVQLTEGEAKLIDLSRRIESVRAAQATANGDVAAAKAAADAVPEDANRPALAPARAASAAASTVCAGVKP